MRRGPLTGPYRARARTGPLINQLLISFFHASTLSPPLRFFLHWIGSPSPENLQRRERERDEGGIVVGGRGGRGGQRSAATVDGETVLTPEAVAAGPAHRLRGLPRRRLWRRRRHAPRTLPSPGYAPCLILSDLSSISECCVDLSKLVVDPYAPA